MSRILIVEDEAHLAEGLRFNLEAEGHSVQISDNGEDALKRLLKDRESFDALVLDVMLPGKDGFLVASELRKEQNYTPLLMLTARGRPEDVLKGFESGADDYLPKPFNLAILIARVESLLRRKNWLAAANAASPQPASTEDSPPTASSTSTESFRFDGKVVDFQNLQLRVGDQVIPLTMMESDLFRCLISNSGRPVSRKQLLQEVWNLHEDTDTRAIDNFIVRLRRYIEEEPSKPRYLLTVRGIGYRFVASPTAKRPKK
ncbi:MAG TPA: response regulator transcription factor [Verrucomicrobiae bacterium]|jgi:DNA-binding response OmpR family regulator|nr:response regulator transcription factor [Verrucomicrobiae bacterium]